MKKGQAARKRKPGEDCPCGKCSRCSIRHYMRRYRTDVTVRQYTDENPPGNPAFRHQSKFAEWSKRRQFEWQRRVTEILGTLAISV